MKRNIIRKISLSMTTLFIFTNISYSSNIVYGNEINKQVKKISIDEITYVKTQEEFVEALENNTKRQVTLLNDIELEQLNNISINGSKKVINGDGNKLIFKNSYCNINAFDFVESIENIKIESQDNINLNLKYGGNISSTNGINVTVNSEGIIKINNSQLARVYMVQASNSMIKDTDIIGQGISIERSYGVVIEDVDIDLYDYSTGVEAGIWSDVIIKNTNINGGQNGIYACLNGNSINLENVNIENSSMYGIYNNGDVNGSNIYLSNVSIKNSGEHGIYNTGNNSTGHIVILKNTTLELDVDNIGIYLKTGMLSVESGAKIKHIGNSYTVFKDINSYIYDYEVALELAKSSGAGEYYNSKLKEGIDSELLVKEVTDEDELREALLDENINYIKFLDDIEINNGELKIYGILKSIQGNGFKLIFNKNSYSRIDSKEYVQIENLKIDSYKSNISINLQQGGRLINIDSEKSYIYSDSTVEILESNVKGVYISNGQKSKIINTDIIEGNISITYSKDNIIDGVNVNTSSGNGIYLDGRSDTTIKNTNVNGGDVGICVTLNGSSVKLENVNIENSLKYGIYNNGDVNGSYIYLSNVKITNIGEYGIYSTGNSSTGNITVLEDTTLELEVDNIGVYLRIGMLSINDGAKIKHIGNGYTVFKDINSYIYDNEKTLELVKSSGAGEYYNSKLKEGNDSDFLIKEVSNENELREALLDKSISNIKILNDIEINNGELKIVGILKSIQGNGFELSFSNNTYPRIESEEYVEIENLNINSYENNISINLQSGGGLKEVNSEKAYIYSNGTVEILDSKINGVYISGGPRSKIINTNIIDGNISITYSDGNIIDNVNVKNNTGNSIMIDGRSITTIKNSNIDGGDIGIYVTLNGRNITLENVSIENCSEYGIYNYGGVNGSSIYLSNVEIRNTGKNSIKSSGGDSSGNIIINENTTLIVESDMLPIDLQYSYLNINGKINHNGSGNTVQADSKSYVYDNSRQLVLIDDINTDTKQYISKYNYDDKIAPEISLNGHEVIELKVGDTYEELGAYAIDNIDGEIVVNIESSVDTSLEGEYCVIYSATDSHGNCTTINRKVIVRSNEVPIIQASNLNVYVGEDVDLLKDVTAFDKEDGDLTNSIIVYGDVNISVPGNYYLSYSVEDRDGNVTYKDIVVVVRYRDEDFNFDGKVDEIDLEILKDYYNVKNGDEKWEERYDLNKDGIIDVYDFVLLSNFLA